MGKDRRRPPGPQSFLFPELPEDIEKSPLWQEIRRAQERLRDAQEQGRFPKITPEMLEQMRQMREALENSAVGKMLREQREREKESEEQSSNVEQAKPARPARKRKRKRGGQRIEIPCLDEVIDTELRHELAKKPSLASSPKRQADIVVKAIKKRTGIEVPASQERTIIRRIKARRKRPKYKG
jgi:hypothetical protein